MSIRYIVFMNKVDLQIWKNKVKTNMKDLCDIFLGALR